MRLRHKIKTIIEVEYGALEQLAHEVYNLQFDNSQEPYEFVAVQECGNDSSHQFHIDGKLEYAGEKESAKRIRSGIIKPYENGDLLNTLCSDGYIIPGEYVIKVSW